MKRGMELRGVPWRGLRTLLEINLAPRSVWAEERGKPAQQGLNKQEEEACAAAWGRSARLGQSVSEGRHAQTRDKLLKEQLNNIIPSIEARK